MSYTASKLVAIAAAEVGYKEKASNANLDDATANAGSANYTKYARDLAAAGYYNGNKNGYAWCDVFVDWCFYQLTGQNKTKAEALECQTGTLGAGCPYSEGYYKAAGRLDTTPKVGDQVFFQQNGSCVHTGIVEKVTTSTITTIEGNSGNQVKRNSYSLTNSYIRSFGHPLYDDEDEDTATTSTEAATETSSTTTTSGPSYPEKFQAWLNSVYSAGLKVDGKYGVLTKKAAIKGVQKYLNATYSAGLTVDGIWGPKTKAALNGRALSNGSKGNLVYILQGVLYCKGYDPNGFDGEYGSGTTAAVKKFQTAKGITVDGKAGANTFAKLFT
ncbi:MAG: peptidoglycan-binding protein [Oscillospiraceae bacterium]|nr:peptidoglycan-binding protein [Oscillospiraceae bacterium]